jgi:tetratricopeptide (TPR) repeat protein
VSKKARASGEQELEPLSGSLLELGLALVAVATMALVALWFSLEVNRVFDVPKAFALKVGGCGAFLVWLVYGLFGGGFAWKSVRIYAAPVAALAGAVIISTFFSIDVLMSFYGVYERQFGLQGFLGCIGIFFVTATCLRSRRGAIAAMASLAIVGGIMGSYSLLQARGVDPFGFFRAPHTKVYSTLGNATFAGNALALIFPVSFVLGLVGAFKTSSKAHLEGSTVSRTAAIAAFVVGFAAIALIELLPGFLVATDTNMGPQSKEGRYEVAIFIAVAVLIASGLSGSWGPEWSRFQSAKMRRFSDAFAAGGVFVSAAFIFIGIWTTRTRGAWVGTAGAIVVGLLLAPNLFAHDPRQRKHVRQMTFGFLGAFVIAVAAGTIGFPESVFAKTIKSMYYAFDSEHTEYGVGQGTRRYLWTESPRVLFNHRATLERKYRDQDEIAKKVKPDAIEGLELPAPSAWTESQKSFDTAWRTPIVYLFGIGIETYRYAFMSHKSKKLEALDPMTNHDNPHNNYLYTLASFGIVGLCAYLWLLWRLLSVSFKKFDPESYSWIGSLFKRWRTGPPLPMPSPTDGASSQPAAASRQTEALAPLEQRAVAFGVVVSFFSYSLYSIAGFDSVCCSVFLYLLLGATAAYFEPQGDTPSRSLWVNIKRQWATFRGRDPAAVPNAAPVGLSIATAIVLGGLLLYAVIGAVNVMMAERAFVGDLTRGRDFGQKVEDIKRSIHLNPVESFYKQNLGSTFSDAARQYRSQALRLYQQGKTNEAQQLAAQADAYSDKAETALYAALDHAWAPENAFISLFQNYYASRKYDKAEYALERALEHSPHLGAVRANLAVLELERGGNAEALKDCLWVIEVDPGNAVALRTCGRAKALLGDCAEGRSYLDRAAAIQPKDSVTRTYLADLDKVCAAKTSSAAGASNGAH